MDLGVAVLASLGGGHLHDLAGPVLRDDGDDCDDDDDGDDVDCEMMMTMMVMMVMTMKE